MNLYGAVDLRTQTYRAATPRKPVSATCAAVDCEAYLNGWYLDTTVLAADLIWAATHSGRKYIEVDLVDGKRFLFFEAGQACFKQHTRYVQTNEVFMVGQGYSGRFAVRDARRHTRAVDWVEDMSLHLDTIRSVIERG